MHFLAICKFSIDKPVDYGEKRSGWKRVVEGDLHEGGKVASILLVKVLHFPLHECYNFKAATTNSGVGSVVDELICVLI